MSNKNPNEFRDPENLTVSEIDRYANYESESDEYSSGDSYRPNLQDDSDSDNDENNSFFVDNPNNEQTDTSLGGPSDIITQPSTSTQNTSSPSNSTAPSNRGKKTARTELTWDDLPEMKTFLFNQVTGLRVPLPGFEPIDYFNIVIDDVFLQSIVTATNEYAVQVFLTGNLTPKSRIIYWKDLTLPEFKIFLGLMFHTGIVHMPQLQQYWKKDELFKTCFGKYMSRDSFFVILRCLHLVCNNEDVENRLQKIKPAIDYFNNKMACIYTPGKELSLDESMVLWRGRLVFKQYIKNKRHKYGIKLYMLTEPNGLVIKFAVYAGAMDILSGEGHTQKVVLYLMEDLLGKGYSIFADNFYNSIDLTKALMEKKTHITGTLRVDRVGVSKEVVKKKLKTGETVSKYHEGIMVGKWRDKRDVLYISNQYENVMDEATNKRGDKKKKPLPIIQYNTYMSGVDRKDQLMSYYPCERKTIRWYKKLLLHVLQMGILNAFILYNNHTIGNKMTMLDFRLAIIRKLLKPEVIEEAEQVVDEDANVDDPEATKHLPTKLRLLQNGKRGRRRCTVCSRNGRRKDTTFECKACPENPALCLENCFDFYHK